ncbi:hypothetical protein [Hymenobacter coccineus]|uniref:hypothetical protein n=1 Tax=Hymenobacter coccineus TaxID=1908235 RepID=UPI000F798AFE|nr:hypothetical protein [Hymenobacter coccineus]
MRKLEHDLQQYNANQTVFQLLDCLLTLNSIPEWIANDPSAPASLSLIAKEKIVIMKGQKPGFLFDESLLDSDIDQILRLIRLVSNHSKHKTDSPHIPTIENAGFPYTFPVKLGQFLRVGNAEIDAEDILDHAANFWRNQIAQHPQA